ncbi:MAG: Type secretion system protein [Gemmatimonadetes bacterium]|nr:Type secretion system protein [Gemmatimonadota bacterium]
MKQATLTLVMTDDCAVRNTWSKATNDRVTPRGDNSFIKTCGTLSSGARGVTGSSGQNGDNSNETLSRNGVNTSNNAAVTPAEYSSAQVDGRRVGTAEKLSFMNYRHFARASTLGFTLPEILVSLSLIAALAAVVVPAMLSQVKKGDPTRVGNDVVNIRSAVEAFLGDVRRYPGGFSQLTLPIALTDQPLSGTMPATYFYGTAEVSRWRGSYLGEDATAALKTGFGWKFESQFASAGYGSSGTVASTTSQKYLLLTIGVTDVASAQQLDAMFDDGDLNAGLIRYRVCTAAPACTAGALDTVKFLLMPIY